MRNQTSLFFGCLLNLVPTPWYCYAQSGLPKYNEFSRLYNLGDSCYSCGNFRLAGEFFYQAAMVEIEKGIELSRGDMFYLTSVAFLRAEERNRAYHCLRIAAFDHGFSNLEALMDSSFAGIRQGKAWNVIEHKVRSNLQEEMAKKALYEKRTNFHDTSGGIVFQPVRSTFFQNVFCLDSLPFISVNHGNFRLYFSADSYAARHLPKLKTEIDLALHRALTILDTTIYNKGISLVFFNSPEEMKAVTGIKALGGIAYPDSHVAFFPYTPNRRFQFNHEIFHVISLNIWGDPSCRLLMEGGAVYADNQCHIDNPILVLNAFYLRQHHLLPIDSLLYNFDMLAQQDDVKAYLQSAAIFKYLLEKYGPEKMKKLWTSGFDIFQEIFGIGLNRFEEDYREYLKQIPIPADFQESVIEEGCG